MNLIALAGRMGTGKDTVAALLAERGWQRIALADEMKRIALRLFEFTPHALWGPSSARNEVVTLTSGSLWPEAMFRAGEMLPRIVNLYSDAIPEEAVRSAFMGYLIDCWRVDRTLHGLSARYALQRMGTEMGRGLDEGVWIAALAPLAKALSAGVAGYDPAIGLTGAGAIPPGIVVTDCRFPNEARAFRRWGGRVFWVDASARVGELVSTHSSEPGRGDFEGLLDGTIDNNGTLATLPEEVARVAQQEAP